jgi:hypothetical protein
MWSFTSIFETSHARPPNFSPFSLGSDAAVTQTKPMAHVRIGKPRILLGCLEAAIGIEPMNKGFADLCLTTWLRRPPERMKDEG